MQLARACETSAAVEQGKEAEVKVARTFHCFGCFTTVLRDTHETNAFFWRQGKNEYAAPGKGRGKNYMGCGSLERYALGCGGRKRGR
jgi:hypothetical protein